MDKTPQQSESDNPEIVKTALLEIKDLKASIQNKEILKGINLSIHKGEIHVIMGPNGSGKSTLAHVLMGHPKYTVTEGTAMLAGEDLMSLKTSERARKGLFLAFQYPVEVPGVTLAHFLWNAHTSIFRSRGEIEKDSKAVVKFRKSIMDTLSELRMAPEFAVRHLNVGASGGEKKRLEITQMFAIKPKIAILDEIDSGLDIDSTRITAEAIGNMKGPDFSAIIITHYPRILEYIHPDRVHVMADGKILCSRGMELARQLEEKGYEWILKEYNNGTGGKEA